MVDIKINDSMNELEIIGKSYTWENRASKTTIPVQLWVEALIMVLYDQKSTTNVEELMTSLMPKVTKPSNNMYINSLLRKMYLDAETKTKVSNFCSRDEFETWVVKRINNITNKHHDKASSNMKKLIGEWRDHYQKVYSSQSVSNVNSLGDIMDGLKSETLKDESRIVWEIKKEFSSWTTKVGLNNVSIEEPQSSIREEIGKMGESMFNDMLIKKYGIQNVKWTSSIQSYSPYDFEVNEDGKTIYFEVKTTSKATHKLGYKK